MCVFWDTVGSHTVSVIPFSVDSSDSRRLRARPPCSGRCKSRGNASAAQTLPGDFSKRLIQRAARGPDFRRFARDHEDILHCVAKEQLQLVLFAVHQPDWPMKQDELASLDTEGLVEALKQYLRRHREADAGWEKEQTE